jgi:hypothetical protein
MFNNNNNNVTRRGEPCETHYISIWVQYIFSTFVHIYRYAYMGSAAYICHIYAIQIYGAIYKESVCGNSRHMQYIYLVGAAPPILVVEQKVFCILLTRIFGAFEFK